MSSCARRLSQSSSKTSLASGRTRASSLVTGMSFFPSSPRIFSASLPMVIPLPLPALTVWPIAASLPAMAMKAAAVSRDVREVAHRAHVPQAHLAARERLADDGRDDRPRRLPRAVRVERPERRHRKPEAPRSSSRRSCRRRSSRPNRATAPAAGASRRWVCTARCRRFRTWTCARRAACRAGARPRAR